MDAPGERGSRAESEGEQDEDGEEKDGGERGTPALLVENEGDKSKEKDGVGAEEASGGGWDAAKGDKGQNRSGKEGDEEEAEFGERVERVGSEGGEVGEKFVDVAGVEAG
jgi:hypothetical protein